MVIYGDRTLLTRCHVCGRLRQYHFNIFDISREKENEFNCKCGEENINLRLDGKNRVLIKVSCFTCQQKHIYRCSLKEFLIKENIFLCHGDTKICYIGSDKGAANIIKNNQMDFGYILEEAGFDDYFNDFKIFAACLNRVEYLNDEGKITCECGNDDIIVDIFPDRLELRCLECGSIKIVYAENENDLKVLLNKDKIFMRKHSFACIDSIIDSN